MGELALVMGGGGARGAYQVGFLRHLARRHPDLLPQILTGVSAGAINTFFMASHPGPFPESVAELGKVWSELRVQNVFEADVSCLARSFVSWGLRLVMGGSRAAPRTRGLVDTTPLRRFLEHAIGAHAGGPDAIERNVASGRVRAVALTTTSYATGRSVTWVQGRDLALWRRPHREAIETRLGLEHAMASGALPLFFPAVQIDGAWHGDGGIRLTAPLAPAIHLGADRILAVSTRYRGGPSETPLVQGYPPPAQVLGVLLNAIFLDMLDYDALVLERTNQLLRELPPDKRLGLREVRLFVLRPSVDLGRLASAYEPELPRLFRWMMRSTGTRETKSPDSLSMLMFQPDYIERLMEIGERDAEEAAPDLERFLAE